MSAIVQIPTKDPESVPGAARVTAANARENLTLIELACAERLGPQGQSWRERVAANDAALEESLRWFISQGDGEPALRFINALAPFWSARGEGVRLRSRLTEVLALPSAAEPSLPRAKALYEAGLLAFRQADNAASRACNEESLSVGRHLADKPTMAMALIGLSRLALRQHDFALVTQYATEALQLRAQIGDSRGEVAPVHMLGAAARMQRDTENAAKYYALTLGIHGAAGNKLGVAGELMNLAFVHIHRHDPDWAFRLLRESISIYRELNSEPGLAWNIGGFAAVAAERRDGLRAARLYGALAAAMKRLGLVLDPDDQFDFDQYSAMARTQIGTTAFDGAVAEGRQLSVEEALALATGA